MTRYFVHSEGGADWQGPEKPGQRAAIFAYPDGHSGPVAPLYTEVQVVPLDAVVIDRADLPEVTPVDGFPGEVKVSGGGGSWTRAFVEQNFRPFLAAHRWFEQHPPIDEAAVKQAKIALVDVSFVEGSAENIARDLVRKGYRIQVSS